MSGMMELYPVLLSSRSGYVKVSAAEVEALSPMRHLDRIACPVIVVHGDQESPEFKRQASVFAEALSGMGGCVRSSSCAGKTTSKCRKHSTMLLIH
jgi:arylformamidase